MKWLVQLAAVLFLLISSTSNALSPIDMAEVVVDFLAEDMLDEAANATAGALLAYPNAMCSRHAFFLAMDACCKSARYGHLQAMFEAALALGFPSVRSFDRAVGTAAEVDWITGHSPFVVVAGHSWDEGFVANLLHAGNELGMAREAIAAARAMMGRGLVGTGSGEVEDDWTRKNWLMMMGRLWAALGEHGKAFAHFQVANGLDQVQLWDAPCRVGYQALSAALAATSPDKLRELRQKANLVAGPQGEEGGSGNVQGSTGGGHGDGAGGGEVVPVVILGLPRSGTTLMERVLSVHPAVMTAGEFGSLTGVAVWLEKQRRSEGLDGLIDTALALDREDLLRLQQEYQASFRERAGGEGANSRTHLVGSGKSEAPFAWLLPLLAPRAKVIVMQRDPRDRGLSCYTHDFHHTSPAFVQCFNDLRSIAGFHNAYTAVVRRLQEASDTGSWPIPVLTVSYEDLVLKQRGTTAEVLRFLGLPWHEGCMRPEKFESTHGVSSNSAIQVRAGVNRKSIGQWRKFESWLGPLLEELQ